MTFRCRKYSFSLQTVIYRKEQALWEQTLLASYAEICFGTIIIGSLRLFFSSSVQCLLYKFREQSMILSHSV